MQQPSSSVNRPALVEICEHLGRHKVEELKYLVQDNVGLADLERCVTALDIFSLLERDKIIPILDKIVAQCLILMDQFDLVKFLNLNPEDVSRDVQDDHFTLKPFRKAMFNIAKDLSDADVENLIKIINSMLHNFTPAMRQLENTDTSEKVFRLFNTLEKRGDITENNCLFLKKLLLEISRDDLNSFIQPFSGPDEMDEYYPMNPGYKGQCVIISNYIFCDRRLANRDGTHFDLDALAKTFRQLNFQITEHTDLSAKKIHDVTDALSREDHSRACAFVVCILSHGDNGKVFGTDGKIVHLKDITAKYTATNCKSLAGKPKIFITQACQGQNEHILPDRTVRSTRRSAVVVNRDINPLPPEPMEIEEEDFDALQIHDKRDFLIASSTVPGYMSYRNPESGSLYIQTLCQQINQRYRSQHMVDILTEVNNQLSKENIELQNGTTAKTTAAIFTSLRLKLHFFPENTRS